MKFSLRELEAVFLTREDDIHRRETDTLDGADGIMFLCPKCYEKNRGSRGTHVIVCWFVGRVPDSEMPGPGRWTPQGTSLDDLTFVPSEGRSQSVLLTGGCQWHGYVTKGHAYDNDPDAVTPAPRLRRKNPEYKR